MSKKKIELGWFNIASVSKLENVAYEAYNNRYSDFRRCKFERVKIIGWASWGEALVEFRDGIRNTCKVRAVIEETEDNYAATAV